MNEDRPAGGERAADGPGDTAPHLDESVRRIAAAGRDTLDAGLDSGRALRKLISADFALARSAVGRALAWAVVAIVFGASAWLLVIGMLVALLNAAGLSWLASVSIATVISLAITGLAAWRMVAFFEHAGMHATRRQLTRLGLFQEPEDGDEDEDEAATASTPETSTR